MKEIAANSLEETRSIAKSLAELLTAGDTICLDGDLGAGKTTFARFLAEALGVPASDVNSPTFTIVNEYHMGRVDIQHFDLYRLDSLAQLDAIGYLELLKHEGLNIIEWGALFPEYLPPDYIAVEINNIEDTKRMFRIYGVGERSQDILEKFIEC